MSEENVDRYRRLGEAFEREDLDAFLAFFDPDVDFAPRSMEMEGGRSFRGHDGIRNWWRSMFTAFSVYTPHIDEVQDLGDVTFARTRLCGRGMESGTPIEQTQWHVVEWRHGMVIRWRTFPGEIEALEAAGLSE